MTRAILVVDDDPLLRHAMVEAIQRLGLTVHDTYSGERALAILAGQPEIDTLVTDVRMPAMDGVSLARDARSLRPGLRVVLISAYGKRAAPDGCLFLHKPWRERDLRALLVRAPAV